MSQTERCGPGPFSIILSVVLSLALGVVLAAVYLVFKPVIIVKDVPQEPVLGEVYLVTGSQDAGKAAQWMRKRQMLAEGGMTDITFNEDELNAWVASMIPDSEINLKPGADVVFKSDSNGPSAVLGRPNFRIRDGVVQVGVPAKAGGFGFSRRVVFQTSGHFVKGKNGYVFAPDTLYLGSLPTQLIPGLKDLIMQRVIAAEDIPDDLMAGWEKLAGVSVQGDVLHLSLP